MKKCLSSLVAGLFLLFSAGVNAAVIESSVVYDPINASSGRPGDTVSIDVFLFSGDITGGGDFSIDFESEKLTFIEIKGGIGFEPFNVTPYQSKSYFSLAQDSFASLEGPVDYSIFSIWFTINSPYPFTTMNSDVAKVTISGYLYDIDSIEFPIVPIDQNIAVSLPDGTIPEPGALALVALALLIMTGVGRRSRLFR